MIKLFLGWAEDQAVLSDYDSPELQLQLPCMAAVALNTLRFLPFRVNRGAGQTEAMVSITGVKARQIRGEILGGDSCCLLLSAGHR